MRRDSSPTNGSRHFDLMCLVSVRSAAKLFSELRQRWTSRLPRRRNECSTIIDETVPVLFGCGDCQCLDCQNQTFDGCDGRVDCSDSDSDNDGLFDCRDECSTIIDKRQFRFCLVSEIVSASTIEGPNLNGVRRSNRMFQDWHISGI